MEPNGIPINRTDGTDGAAMERTDGVKSVNPRDELAMQPTPPRHTSRKHTGTQNGYPDMQRELDTLETVITGFFND